MKFGNIGYHRVIKKWWKPDVKEGNKTPEGILAAQKVYEAKKSGKLKVPKACQKCGTQNAKRLIAHHHNYDKPLEVIFICDACHREEHPQMRTINDFLCPRCFANSKNRWGLCPDCQKSQEQFGNGYKQNFYPEIEEWYL